MMMLEISESKVSKLSEHIEEGLRHIGKAMQCVDQLMNGEYGERGSMGYREQGTSRYGGGRMNERYPYMDGHIGYRDEEDLEDEMHERRGRRRDSRGRYY